MTRWTQEQFEMYQAKHRDDYFRKWLTPDGPEVDEGKESVLQGKIERWCEEWGRPYLSFRQSKRAKGFLRQTWVDVTIGMPVGRTLYLELKAAGGRMSDDQKKLRLQLMALGHEIHEVRSWKRFLEIVTMAGKETRDA